MNAAATLPNGAALVEKLKANPRLPLMLGGAALVAAIAVGVMWSRQPDYKVLYTNLSERDGGAVIQSLQQMNVPYKFAEGGGAVMVPAEKVHETRLRLASQGLPKSGTTGMELMDNQKFGISQFAEQVNYQRGLEGELARSIESIGAVQSARVHLAIPKPTLFVRERQKPTASVVLQLYPGRAIDEGQVAAITHLVSSSVPELTPKSISIVDQHGNLLSGTSDRSMDATQLKYVQQVEQNYVKRVESILTPILGKDNVHAQVTADVDFSSVEHTDESFKPNQDPTKAAIRSQQTSESNQQGASPVGGVPGALSNQPPAAAVAPVTTPQPPRTPGQPNPAQANQPAQNTQTAEKTGPSSSRRDATTNYELDRTVRHVQQAPGGVKRLSVAVVVNYRTKADAKGKPVTEALSAKELAQIENLTKEAMGFSAERGDSLNVVNSPFTAENAKEPEPPLWKQPQMIDLAKTGVGYLLLALLAMFLWFKVARPVLRKYTAPPLPAPTEADATAEAVLLPPEEETNPEVLRLAAKYESDLALVRDAAQRDPRLVASVIKTWMANDEG
ncbi:MAG: flagellar basal body M-ring protein FliF [Cupriavidus sp.]|jgi:flagellar M-ring protein FliF|uniref:flagellar basal-body MS-ring/collar protein FliF n=1 Tax=Cupriavidus pauculus TaxID=82633 RepID=UPI000784FD2F|nr:flagellar basal-body MS-ring/collar protein FliF [Cupriavidus pauculus]MBU65260.1 flagellar basal body M-ring protein FliF [Cupriavidus sp.]KAB0603909.1 flagellar basal body M-ring protein FliF [Cupriavidus pauculus]MBY4730207.1 flagellar M-ring protein FliF [Cupriavidus pauculus]MCM3607801.1 flagellar M-ring protein FliF [Cupriavidus pauculus]UAL03271.1 flagellar M-ring protein FliF [Cupriavidus pauculus]